MINPLNGPMGQKGHSMVTKRGGKRSSPYYKTSSSTHICDVSVRDIVMITYLVAGSTHFTIKSLQVRYYHPHL